jgi:hypothetical protein
LPDGCLLAVLSFAYSCGRYAALTLVLLAAAMAQADVAPDNTATSTSHAPPAQELLWELDAYYSNVSLQIPLTTTPLPEGGQLRERDVYRRLFLDSLKPRILLLEASIYPLPIAGTWFKHHHPENYDNFNIGTLGNNQLNIIDGVTAGFQEPWAVSAFIGSSMAFSQTHSNDSTANKKSASENNNPHNNRGYMGYLVSAGAKHIHNNVLIDDNWWELEWKLKGERDVADEELSWSFRLGVKNHGNVNIRDVAYIGLRRSNLNYQSAFLGLLNNSNLELMTEVDRTNLRFLRQEITLGRRIPIQSQHIALSLDIGLIYEDDSKYSGALTDPSADALTFIFRPNIKF